jgi:hypothetical protein
MKAKGLNEAQFLSLLQKVLPTKTNPHLASEIYEEVDKEIRLLNCLASFEKFCEKGALPDSEPATVKELQTDLAEKFGEDNVTITPAETGAALEVEIALPDRTVANKVKVDPTIANAEEEVKVPFVPFPITLPEDPELVWVLARREDLAPEEAARSLAKIEEEFWQTKAGIKMQRDRVEKSFAEFIANVPAASLTESGIKRHYKEPEPLQSLRRLAAAAPKSEKSAEQKPAEPTLAEANIKAPRPAAA